VLEEEAEIGILALEKGLISQDALNDCLSTLSEDPGRSIVDLLTQKKLLSQEQVRGLRQEAHARIRARSGEPSESGPAAPPELEEVVLKPQDAAPDPGMPPEAAQAAREPSNRIGGVVRVRQIGDGTHAVVYRAWDPAQRAWVVLKLLKEAGGAQGAARFIEEAGATVGMDHPGVVRIHGVGPAELGGLPTAWITMDFVEGAVPADTLRKQGMPLKRAAEIVRDAALAVDFAHGRGVIHKDLKPRNLLVQPDGKVRVADFGLAAVAATLGPSEDSLLSRTIQVQGTPEFMSPEQALGRTGDIRERSDIYSLGASLYFLVTGRPPFDSGSAMKTCFAVVRDPVVPPSQINPEVPSQLEQIIVRAMAKDPVRRYDTARHLSDDLGRFIQGVPILTDDQMRLTQGVAALYAGRLEEAIHMFKELIRLELAGRLGSLGLQSVMKQLEEGENGVSLAIQQQTKNYDIRTQRGVYRFAKAIITSLDGNDPSSACKAALEDFVKACELRAESTAARINRSNVLIFGGRFARDSGKDVTGVFTMAMKDLDAALEFDPICTPAYHNRGIVNFYIAQATKKAGGDPEPAFRRAIDDFSRAAELDPTYGYIFKDLGVVKISLAKHLLSRGEKVKSLFTQAVAHLDIAVQLNGSIYGAVYERGQALFALKDFKGAIRDFRRCLELDPSREKKVQALIEEAQKHVDTKRL
jgi:tetratricopeptide (TPR) repeat protein